MCLLSATRGSLVLLETAVVARPRTFFDLGVGRIWLHACWSCVSYVWVISVGLPLRKRERE